eukprot:TRINITY_DN3032_c0_g1_i1.p1 TRINITY_DN3032_c0_g1~~TRINITY_DN3032_c0_g1_i1.p1  ORF type:complete len:155 (-),score=28.08 TRINITY_DN3032_c0_g1_i1:405-869(-)
MMCDGYLLIDSAFLLKKEADIVALEERLNSCKNELSSEIQTIKSSLKAENIEKALKALQLGQTSRKKKHQDLTALHRIKDRLSLAKELSLFERDALESYKDKLNQVYTNLSVAQEDVNNLMVRFRDSILISSKLWILPKTQSILLLQFEEKKKV